jgi:hypothetical protein
MGLLVDTFRCFHHSERYLNPSCPLVCYADIDPTQLLPQHLHDEIDSASYYSSSGHYQQGSHRISPSRELISTSRSIPLDDCPRSHTTTGERVLGDSTPGRHRLPRGQTSSRSGYLSTQPLSSDDASPSTALYPSPGFASTRSSQVLPPIRDLRSLQDRNLGRHSSRVKGAGYSKSFSPDYGNNHQSDLKEFVSRNPSSGTATLPRDDGIGQPLATAEVSRFGQTFYEGPRYRNHPICYRTDLDHPTRCVNNPQQSSFAVLPDSADPRSKRRRGNLPKPVTDILRAWFHDHLDHPYPSEEDKQMFISRTGLTIGQVS